MATPWLTFDEAQSAILRRIQSPAKRALGPVGDMAGVTPDQAAYLTNLGMDASNLLGKFRPEYLLKLKRGQEIANEVGAKYKARAAAQSQLTGRKVSTEDNRLDAQRHAEWTWRTAKELGPGFAEWIGLAHETLQPNLPYARKMDLYNNAKVLEAYRSGRPYDPDALQVDPYSIPRRGGGVAASYARRPQAGR